MAKAAFTIVSQPSGVTQGIVATKARFAKQGLTMPSLELFANLATKVREAFDGYPLNEVYCWLDSAVALYWIRGEGDCKQFVHNCVQNIQEKK